MGSVSGKERKFFFFRRTTAEAAVSLLEGNAGDEEVPLPKTNILPLLVTREKLRCQCAI